MKKAVILGSSRKNGDTKTILDKLNLFIDFDLFDLNDFNFSYYDYNHQNRDDDYIELMRKLIDNYDIFIFATPVYWYSMSGIMKVFFDRITDLLEIEKDLGRRLRDKNMAVISCSIGNNLGEYFWLPFIETANYLGINYVGNLHLLKDEDESNEIEKFVETIKEFHKNDTINS